MRDRDGQRRQSLWVGLRLAPESLLCFSEEFQTCPGEMGPVRVSADREQDEICWGHPSLFTVQDGELGGKMGGS